MHDVRLKICDLCGAPNLIENTECHVCGWRGHFSTEPEKVRCVIEVARKLGLHETTSEHGAFSAPHTKAERIWRCLGSWFNRRRRSPHPPM